jgi:hypothetical protein
LNKKIDDKNYLLKATSNSYPHYTISHAMYEDLTHEDSTSEDESCPVNISITDDDCIYSFRTVNTSSPLYRIWTDDRLYVVHWVIDNMIIQNNMITIVNNDFTLGAEISQVIYIMMHDRQFVALETLYQASLNQGFLFDFNTAGLCVFGHDDTVRTIILLDWIYDRFGITSCIFHPDSLSRLITQGDIKVLEWVNAKLLLNDMPFVYNTLSLQINHIAVLNFLWDLFLKGQMEFKYDASLLGKCAKDFKCNCTEIFEWFFIRRDTLEFIYDNQILDQINYHLNTPDKCIAILDWWFNNRDVLQLKYTNKMIDFSNIIVWDYLYKLRDEIELKYTADVISYGIILRDPIKILQWWYDRRHELKFKYHKDLLLISDTRYLHWFTDHLDEFPLTLNKCISSSELIDETRTWCINNFDRLEIVGNAHKIWDNLNHPNHQEKIDN